MRVPTRHLPHHLRDRLAKPRAVAQLSSSIIPITAPFLQQSIVNLLDDAD